MAPYFFIFMCLAYPAVQAEQHVQHDVGGSSGWSDKTDLAAWASTQVFTKGDTIVFFYNSQHGVDIVTQEDYNSCNSANPLKSYSNGLTTIKLKKEGPMYFIDPIPRQCQAGMKLAIDIRAKGDTSPPATSSSPAGGKPIGYMIPNPYGAGTRKLSSGLASVLLVVVVLLIT